MDRYKLKWTKLQDAIIRFLCVNVGEGVSQRKMAMALGVSPTAVSKALENLLKKDLVTIKELKGYKNILTIELNQENPKAIELKRVKNLEMIYDSNLVNFLKEKFPGCAIIVFGSYSRGEDNIESDIDLAIIGSKKRLDLAKYENLLGRDINIEFYKKLEEINKNLRENIFNGIVLSGGIKL